jgi:hypothetical protein
LAISAAPASADTTYAALSTCLAEHVTAEQRASPTQGVISAFSHFRHDLDQQKLKTPVIR